MPIVPISDPADPRLEDYRNIPDPTRIAEHGLFVAEGRLVVRRLLTESRYIPRSLLLTNPARTALADVIDRRPDLPVFVVAQEIVQRVTGFDIHRGCLAIGERPARRTAAEVVRHARRVLVLERVGNPDNVGGIFRTAAAFGADAVLLGPGCSEPLYRKAIRTSMGAALVVPFAQDVPWPGVLHELRDAGIVVVGLTPALEAVPLVERADALGRQRVAVLVGHEGEGLSAEALAACDERLRIPMAAAVDSLNVVVAAAIALYELNS